MGSFGFWAVGGGVDNLTSRQDYPVGLFHLIPSIIPRSTQTVIFLLELPTSIIYDYLPYNFHPSTPPLFFSLLLSRINKR